MDSSARCRNRSLRINPRSCSSSSSQSRAISRVKKVFKAFGLHLRLYTRNRKRHWKTNKRGRPKLQPENIMDKTITLMKVFLLKGVFVNVKILHMNKSLPNDISFSFKVQMVQVKINLYLSLSVYSLISM